MRIAFAENAKLNKNNSGHESESLLRKVLAPQMVINNKAFTVSVTVKA